LTSAAPRLGRPAAQRLANKVQLTTDGHHVYLDAVAGAFGEKVDYAMLIKLYGEDHRAVRGGPGL